MHTVKFYFYVYVLLHVGILVTARRMAGSPCIDDADCEHLKNATCTKGFCECDEMSHCEEKFGRMVTKLGLECEYHAECNIDHSECENKKCVCKPGYTYTDDGKRCLAIADGIGSECEDSVQCYVKIANTGCQDNKCVCLQHMHESNGSCYQNVELGDKCTNHGDCSLTYFAKCIDGRCNCIDKHISVATLTGHTCLPISESVNSTCIKDIQCSTSLGEGARCMNGFCKCTEMYQFKKKINKCVKDIMLNEICENHDDCHQPFEPESRLECIMGICKCRSPYKEEDGLCTSAAHHYQAISTTLVFIFVIFLSINFL